MCHELRIKAAAGQQFIMGATFDDLTLIERHPDLGGWVTAADLSPESQRLTLLVNAPEASVWIFEPPEAGDRFLSSKSRRLRISGVGQAEGLTFESEHNILITNEQREIFALDLDPTE